MKWWLRRFGHTLDVDLYLLGPPLRPAPTPAPQPPPQSQHQSGDQRQPQRSQADAAGSQSGREQGAVPLADGIGEAEDQVSDLPLNHVQQAAALQQSNGPHTEPPLAHAQHWQQHASSSAQQPSTTFSSAAAVAAADSFSSLEHSLEHNSKDQEAAANQQALWNRHQRHVVGEQQAGKQPAERLHRTLHTGEQGPETLLSAGHLQQPQSMRADGQLWPVPAESSHDARPIAAPLQQPAQAASSQMADQQREGQLPGPGEEVREQQQEPLQGAQLPVEDTADGLAATTQQADYDAGQLTGQLLALGLLLMLTLMLINTALLSLPCLLGTPLPSTCICTACPCCCHILCLPACSLQEALSLPVSLVMSFAFTMSWKHQVCTP